MSGVLILELSALSELMKRYSTASIFDDAPLGYAHLETPEENPAETSDQWDMNYLEASIYLEEGENNDKFTFHPRSRDALPAYNLVHNQIFYCLDLAAAIALLSLALTEKPAVPGFAVSEWLVVLVIMIIEAVVVLGRQTSHFRVTRALRPVFLIDNHYCKGIRR
ncbi:two pore calcium channel protein 1 [Trichonephila clavipes]|nr:two pore calcium channel protein 1 [Trichonephila clavipes]